MSLLEVRKIGLDNTFYTVVTPEEYYRGPELFDPRSTAIMYGTAVLPVVSDTSCNIGANVNAGLIYPVRFPETPEDIEKYSTKNMIDMSKPTNYGEIVKTTHEMRDIEREILTNVDNLTVPPLSDKDSPEMKGLKEAIIEKECDINSYSHRFGPNFPNEKRLLNEHDISLKKLKVYGNAMDMKMTLTIEDANPDVPNPIGRSISVQITGGGDDE